MGNPFIVVFGSEPLLEGVICEERVVFWDMDVDMIVVSVWAAGIKGDEDSAMELEPEPDSGLDEVISFMPDRLVEEVVREVVSEVREEREVRVVEEMIVVLVVACTEELLGNVSWLAVVRVLPLVPKLVVMLVSGATASIVESGCAVEVKDGGGDELVVISAALVHRIGTWSRARRRHSSLKL